MRSSRKATSEIFNNPILIGAVTILVMAVAVYLSYIAENGLPFVSTYSVKVDVPNANELTKNADVRIGGARVGQVLTIQPEPAGTDPGYPRPFARLGLSLQTNLQPLPYDTKYQIRLASVLGGKYLELIPGHAPDTQHTPALPDGGVFRLGTAFPHNIPTVDLDTAFRTFGPATQRGLRRSTAALGEAVAGRGTNFNDSIYELDQLIGPLDNVLALLASRRTHLSQFISGAAATANALAPVAPTISALLSDSAVTFDALNRSSLGQTIDQLPSTEAVGTTVLTNARPVLADAAAVVQELKPGAALLPQAAHGLDQIIRAATPVFKLTPALATNLETALVNVDKLASNPASIQTFRILGSNDLATFGASAFVGLGAILSSAAEGQLACNIEGSWAANFGGPNNPLSEGDQSGTWLRSNPVLDQGTLLQSPTPATNLHLNYYPQETAGHCTAGNEHWSPGQNIGQPRSFTSRVPQTSPPPGVLNLAKKAGLLGTYK
jgi:phospholipid/cholesterol/gamma-HCH transport system substrate-binding protein